MNEKECVICNEVKPVSEFYKDARMRTGFSSECKLCRRARNNKYTADHPNGRRRRTLASKYQITIEDYERQYQYQNGLCAICSDHKEKLFIDHCHDTNKVRGLICNTCNFGLGHFRDNVKFMENAINYLNSNGNWDY